MEVMPTFCSTSRWVRYGLPKVIQKRIRFRPFRCFTRDSSSSWYIRYMSFTPHSGKSKGVCTESGSVVTHFPSSQNLPRWVISRMLISGLKLVANALPWLPALQSMMSTVWISSKWCFWAQAQ